MALRSPRLPSSLKRRLAASPLFDLYRNLRGPWELYRWRRGALSQPPPLLKQRLVGSFAERFKTSTLVETGTFFGDMIEAHRRTFDKIYSIELDPWLLRRAGKRFSRRKNIELLLGDSAELLPTLLPRLREPCLFWLDAHAMVGGVRGAAATPIVQELAAILEAGFQSSVILIDDIRLFTGTGDYPALEWVRERVFAAWPDAIWEVEDDILRIYPSSLSSGSAPGEPSQNDSNCTPRPSARRLT